MTDISPNVFADLCAQELELCGLKEGEVDRRPHAGRRAARLRRRLPGRRRAARRDRFHVRLPEASTTLLGDAGAWTVGATPLGDNRPAVEALKGPTW